MPLHRSGGVAIHDGALDGDASATHRVVFVRAGAPLALHRAPAPAAVGDPTRVLLANAGEPLSARLAPGMVTTTLAFCAEAIARPFARRDVTVTPETLLAFHALRGALVRGDVDAHDVEARSIALLRQVLAAGAAVRRATDGAGTRRRREIVETARALLVRAPGRPHPLTGIADALDISASHLAHVFRAEMGMPLHQYLLHLRLAVALERLADGDAQLSALALDLGFATHSHFSAAFRKWYGASPAAVRRMLGGERSARPGRFGAALQAS